MTTPNGQCVDRVLLDLACDGDLEATWRGLGGGGAVTPRSLITVEDALKVAAEEEKDSVLCDD